VTTLAVAWSVAPVEPVRGEVLVVDVPLSFWGGVDPATGRVIDRHHPLHGASLAGRVLVMPSGRGSCSASGVLLESICLGTGPAAILTLRPDPILVLGAVLAEELHGLTMPVGTLDPSVDIRGLSGRAIMLTFSGAMAGAAVAFILPGDTSVSPAPTRDQ